MKIVFNDGTELKNVQLIYMADKELKIKTIKTPAETLKALFKDPEKTQKITLIDGHNSLEYEGFITFVCISEYDGGILEVTMNRPGETIAERLDEAEALISTAGNDINDLSDAVLELAEIIGGGE